jgi:hypothetical protein
MSSTSAAAATPALPTITPTSTFKQLFPVSYFWGTDMMRTGAAKSLCSTTSNSYSYMKECLNDELKRNRCVVLFEYHTIGDYQKVYLIIGKKGSSYDALSSDASDKLQEGELTLPIDKRSYIRYEVFKCPYSFEDVIIRHFARGPDENTGDTGGELYKSMLSNFLASPIGSSSAAASSAAASSAAANENESSHFTSLFTKFKVKSRRNSHKKRRETRRTRRNRRSF